MNGFVTDGNDINCRECKYGDKCNVGRGHGYRVGSCIQFEVEKKQTNADRIRAMSDEELADFLEKVADGCDSCPMLKECTYSDGEMSEEQVRLMWLKKETET